MKKRDRKRQSKALKFLFAVSRKNKNKGRWSYEEQDRLLEAVDKFGEDW